MGKWGPNDWPAFPIMLGFSGMSQRAARWDSSVASTQWVSQEMKQPSYTYCLFSKARAPPVHLTSLSLTFSPHLRGAGHVAISEYVDVFGYSTVRKASDPLERKVQN